jgi:hypothetical protein
LTTLERGDSVESAIVDALVQHDPDVYTRDKDDGDSGDDDDSDDDDDESSADSGLQRFDDSSPSISPTDSDVLIDNGSPNHIGNVNLRRVIPQYASAYGSAPICSKAGVVRDVLEYVRNLDPPGR